MGLKKNDGFYRLAVFAVSGMYRVIARYFISSPFSDVTKQV